MFGSFKVHRCACCVVCYVLSIPFRMSGSDPGQPSMSPRLRGHNSLSCREQHATSRYIKKRAVHSKARAAAAATAGPDSKKKRKKAWP